MKTANRLGVTILELTIVILIVSILASISLGVYTGYLRRARFAVARTEIRELGLNATRHEVDLGEFPLSSSNIPGTAYLPFTPGVSAFVPTWGCGYLTLSLLHSLSADALNPTYENGAPEPRWFGPYMSIQREDLGAIDLTTTGTYFFKPEYDATDSPAAISIMDPWGEPYYYVRHDEYETLGATEQSASPFGETYYNPSTYQIFSTGPDGNTLAPPNMGLDGEDDINNFYTE
jgi:type II secretory pathway pseudopilin PulG